MNLTDRVKNAVRAFQKNNFEVPLGKRFLKYGNNKPIVQDWSQVVIEDSEMYRGYTYAAIKKRANATVQLATNNLKTAASKPITDKAKKSEDPIVHPYLNLIDTSNSFSNNFFWYAISTFLDLEGVYYLMAVRAVDGERVGDIQEFKLINPFDVRRIINKETGELGGYVESRDGLVREIPIEMIIEIRNLNPFSSTEPYSMADAARSTHFTMQQAGDYTRHSIKNNMAAPGIIGTDVLMPDEEFLNFKNRIINQEKGVPLFGNGAGAITWDNMQVDMDKAALDKINEVTRDELFSVAGVSKTKMGVEQSGTTRDTSKVQTDQFIGDEIIPQLQVIVDALNQDYKTNYATKYKTDEYRMYIDSPLGKDRDAELKDIEVRDKSYTLYNELINKGYDSEVAAKYACGEVTLEELGEPANDPALPAAKSTPAEDDQAENKHDHVQDKTDIIMNQFDDEQQGLVNQQQGALQNAVVNVQEQVVGYVINRLNKATNAFDSESDIITQRKKDSFQNELELALIAFYGIVVPLYATSVLNRRAKEFGMFGTFKMNVEVKTYIKEVAAKASESHINTIIDDLLVATQKSALEGATQEQLINNIRQTYSSTISQTRAKAIARTETNRAFTTSQFQADKQFIKQNNLEGRVYKKWITRSDNPCPLCVGMAAEPPIPFNDNFADLGDVVSATYEQDGKTKVLKQTIGFEDVQAGNMHVNCACTYQLIIE